MMQTLHAAAEFGCVSYINAQVLNAFVIEYDAVLLLEDVLGAAEKFRIPIYVETHRGTVTQDLLRTVDYCKAIKRLPLTIDFSHYVVAGELIGFSEQG
jgi:sugar phosphate isomerase/epimerase